jgi:hypothetical protein
MLVRARSVASVPSGVRDSAAPFTAETTGTPAPETSEYRFLKRKWAEVDLR